MKENLLQIDKYKGGKRCDLENCLNKATIKVIHNKKNVHYCTEHFNELRSNFEEECSKLDGINKVVDTTKETLYI